MNSDCAYPNIDEDQVAIKRMGRCYEKSIH